MFSLGKEFPSGAKVGLPLFFTAVIRILRVEGGPPVIKNSCPVYYHKAFDVVKRLLR